MNQGWRRAGGRVAGTVAGAIPAPLLERWASLAGWTSRYGARTHHGAVTLRHALEVLVTPPRRAPRAPGAVVGLEDIANDAGVDLETVARWAGEGLLGEPASAGPTPAYSAAAAERVRLVQYLRAHGVSEDAIREAVRSDRLPLLIVDRALGGAGTLTPGEVADRAGIERGFADSIWLALGMPRGQDGDRVFGRREVEALRIVGALRALYSEEEILETVSVLGRAMAQVAGAQVEVFRRAIETRLVDAGAGELDAALRAAAVVELLVGPAGLLIDVAHRRHLEIAARAESVARIEEAAGGLPDQVEAAVGFADLVGYTSASERLTARELAELSTLLLRTAERVVAAHHAQVVKSIGDAVMFAARRPADACAAALDLVEELHQAGTCPPVHVGIAAGPVLRRHADYFGRTVNVASRLCAAAPGDTVLVAWPLPGAGQEELAASGIGAGRPRRMRLKGLSGQVSAVALRRGTRGGP